MSFDFEYKYEDRFISVIIFLLVSISIIAWVTHVIASISGGLWALLLAGILVPPIGIIHGIGVWFGFF